jgi:hypothetical protein
VASLPLLIPARDLFPIPHSLVPISPFLLSPSSIGLKMSLYLHHFKQYKVRPVLPRNKKEKRKLEIIQE